MLQTLAVFADDPTSAKIITAEYFNSPVGTVLSIALSRGILRRPGNIFGVLKHFGMFLYVH